MKCWALFAGARAWFERCAQMPKALYSRGTLRCDIRFLAHSVIEHPFEDSFNRMNTNSLAYSHIRTTMRVSLFATYNQCMKSMTITRFQLRRQGLVSEKESSL